MLMYETWVKRVRSADPKPNKYGVSNTSIV